MNGIFPHQLRFLGSIFVAPLAAAPYRRGLAVCLPRRLQSVMASCSQKSATNPRHHRAVQPIARKLPRLGSTAFVSAQGNSQKGSSVSLTDRPAAATVASSAVEARPQDDFTNDRPGRTPYHQPANPESWLPAARLGFDCQSRGRQQIRLPRH